METLKSKSQGLSLFTQKILDKRENHLYTTQIQKQAESFFEELKEFLFPHFAKEFYYSTDEIHAKLILIKRDLINLLKTLNGRVKGNSEKIAEEFIGSLPEIHDKLWLDADAIYAGDPAADSIDEVILAYPGFLAITIFRIANELYKLKVPIIPRVLTEYGHKQTAIDIHPGAEIGSRFCIDHGTGIVIGETAFIGNNVKIYQGVTLGALSVEKKFAQTKRHPTIEDNVVIYSQAVILGGKTTIGKDSIIGGNAWITQSVPENSVVYNKSEVRVKQNKEFDEPINFII